MEFLGYELTPEGVKPIQNKCAAITNFKTPVNITELRRFLGMAQQLAKFTPELSNCSAPLRDLLSTKNQWLWTDVHNKAFQKVKELLTSPVTLKLYDASRATKLRVDGSRLNGIAVILYQQHGDKWYPVSCASRYLSDAEKNYHPIETKYWQSRGDVIR